MGWAGVRVTPLFWNRTAAVRLAAAGSAVFVVASGAEAAPAQGRTWPAAASGLTRKDVRPAASKSAPTAGGLLMRHGLIGIAGIFPLKRSGSTRSIAHRQGGYSRGDVP